MQIELQNISKRYGFEWIFKQVNTNFTTNNSYAITGANGSGKSTLLKIISGGLVPTSGNVIFKYNDKNIDEQQAAQYISFAAPYIALIEDYTLAELYKLHASFKKMHTQNFQDFLQISQLEKHKDKYIKNYSSGMRQRLKLSFAILTISNVLLLDEPTSNFDTNAIDWYHQLIANYKKDRVVVIGSNQSYEYDFCQQQLNIMDFK